MSVRCHAVHVPHGSDPATRPDCDVTDPSAPGLARCARVAFMAAAATGLSGCLAVVPIIGGGQFDDPIVIGGDSAFDDPSPDSFDDQLFLALVNDERGNASVQLVEYNALLNQAAQGHAEDMVANNYQDHIGLDGSTPGDRVAATGYEFDFLWENIFFGSTKETAAIQTWMESEDGHREALLAAEAEEIGVGVEEDHYVLLLADPAG